jgi:hypothetical protein
MLQEIEKLRENVGNSINDPKVVVEHQSAYRELVDAAHNGERLVQAYTDEDEHTGQSAPEIDRKSVV